ncbi:MULTISPECIES: hypothetical protein [Bacillus cereus group]|uniref:hypothetical protein n=1 Tax=Bacillus cereus group TaxID=86661 RepID=UPI000279EAD6|nr:hypothetical protein [Bacillus cereus]EJR28484.1 hypothetical protein IIE_05323 [Bacillus cereus VD045]HDR4351216.1 hypothetical protein [Bacillus cereus]HDR6958181.1 hypothetical protein [Bacillus cereus]
MKQTILEIYEEVLSGKRRCFPKGTWQGDTHRVIIKILTLHLVNHILKWNDKEIKDNWDLRIIKKWKLGGGCSICFNDSPYRMLNAAFPNRFEPWELKNTPKNYWTKKKALEVLYYWIEEREQLSREKLLDTFDHKWLKERYLDSPLQIYWNSSPYQILNEAYPNQFGPWELKKGPNNCWKSKEESLNIFRDIVQNLDLSTKEMKEQYSLRWVIQHGLRTPLEKFFKDSPYEMLNAAFPGQFNPWDLKAAPNKTWMHKGAAITIIRKEMKKSSISLSELQRIGVKKWMVEKKMATPFNKFWNDSPVKMLTELNTENTRNHLED